MMERGASPSRFQEELEDVVLSWSVDDILRDDLYKNQVEKIPNTFPSIEHYLKFYVAPLIEETRSELCSSLEGISEAPYSKIQCIEEVKPTTKAEACSKFQYYIDVDFWNDGLSGGSEICKARNGDFFVMSSIKPEAVEDFDRYNVTYCMALVKEVAMDEEFQKGFKVKVSKRINIDNDIGDYKYAIFLTNIMTNVRIWRALHFSADMNINFNIIKEVLCPRSKINTTCDACSSGRSQYRFSKFFDKLLSVSLNQSQVDAIHAAISSVQCNHSHFVKLIWGPPGTGKTKTVSALLWILLQMKCRTLTCAPTNVAVVGVCSRLFELVKHFREDAKLTCSPCPLGDILIFGNKDSMEIDDELRNVFLDYRVDILADCFAPSIGWKHGIASMINLLEEGTSKYDMHLECRNDEEESISFLEFLRKQFNAVALPLLNCIENLWIHLPTGSISDQNARDMFALLDVLKTFGNLLSSMGSINNEILQEIFLNNDLVAECLPAKAGSVSEFGFPDGKALAEARRDCLHLLRVLQGRLTLPHDVPKDWIQRFCFQRSLLIFCTASSSSRLHYVQMDPLEVLVIDEAAQLKECESVIPLRLNWLKHAILVGDECQLLSTVKSQVCKEAGFGMSLFGRLVSLGHHKHLLNVQYRMHPAISYFPNAKFYEKKILDGENVKSASYGKHFSDFMYGSYAFINIAEGRDEQDDIGKSWRNMVEVAVVLHVVRSLFKSWDHVRAWLSIGIVSPYSSQVNAIKEKLENKYDQFDGFNVRVESIDGFQGQEDDVIILSTVRSNNKRTIGFLANINRTNVALTRARYNLLILGNSTTLVGSGTIWKELVNDAQERQCFFNASDDRDLVKILLHVKRELDQLDDLLNSDSVLFSTARWKVLFSDKFRKSFAKLKSLQVKKEVIQMLLNLANGWRSKRNNENLSDSFQLARIYRIREHYLVWSVDMVKHEKYVQVIRVWDLLPVGQISRLVKRLDNIFAMYTDIYLEHCKAVSIEGKCEVPMSWKLGQDIIRYKKICKLEPIEDGDVEQLDTVNVMENSKVSESLLLMKFYSLTSGVVKHLLTSSEGSEMDIPFELTDQEEEIIRFPRTTFILGRSGTGKTTILTMKLIQKEQHHFISSEGFHFAKDKPSEATLQIDALDKDQNLNEGNFLKQVFVTVSPKLCSAIRSHICRLQSFVSGGDYSGAVHPIEMHDVSDNLVDSGDIPDSFHDLPQKHYPLVITFWKFLMMLDGTMRNSFFDYFFSESGLPSAERGVSRSVALQALIQCKEVSYESFVGTYWPYFNTQLTKKLDASAVFTQIISHIKGSLEAGMGTDGKLGREEYIKLSDKRVSTLSREARERIYDIFLDYENKKRMNGEFDLSDFVLDLHRRLLCDGHLGDKLDFVYIDEVQDLTMRQIALFKYVCKNFEDGFTFAGDTAQTIARGIDFRFEDIRSLFYTVFLSELKSGNNTNQERDIRIADKFQLNQNFRTHAGVLKLAQSVINLLYNFFPSCVDKLVPEMSLVYGEAPMLLESSNDDNAIITIFGNSGSVGDNLNGFGAEQVVLVRDDHAKKQVFDLVGKQALVLTIVECKGLEFQDVLLYNFFGGSPLENKWRIVYQYMKNQDLLDRSVSRSAPSFDELKHNLLCSELKQLYVAITRTRQRLWICENTSEYCKPMFDYWKRLCLVQVRRLDSSLAQAMRCASSPEEWRVRGIKLFNEENFEMATMCFERAGDEHKEKWARAAGLVATADRIISMNFEMGEQALNKAADIYESIGKAEAAATCHMKVKDFRKAGMLYLEKCGASKLEAAGDCFAMAECWSLAADVYAKSKCFSKCLSSCSKGKLFDAGLQFIEQWKEEPCFSEENHQELAKIKISFLESCALYYFEHGDIRRMMMFVRAFRSMDLIRPFLKSRNLLDELLLMEMEVGNYLEAAIISRTKGDVFLESEILEKGGYFEEATQLIMLYVITNSLWSPGSKGWPLKMFEQKEELTMKAKLIAKNVSDSFYDTVCLEAAVLSDGAKTLSDMSKYLDEACKCQNVTVEIFALRALLDAHLQSPPFKYIWEPELNLDVQKHAFEMMSQNILSAETLMHIWSLWKAVILNVLSYLRLVETPDENNFAAYEDFCLKYLGVRKDDKLKRYVLLNSEAFWITSGDDVYLQRDRNLICINSHQFVLCSQNFWKVELVSVGMAVLKKLESLNRFSVSHSASGGASLAKFSPKMVFYPFSIGRVILSIYEVAKFLKGSEIMTSRSVSKLQKFFSLAENCFFDIVFPFNWRLGMTESMLTFHESKIAEEILGKILLGNLQPWNGKLTHGQIGRVVMLLFLTGQLTGKLFEKIMTRVHRMQPWKELIAELNIFWGWGYVRVPVFCRLQAALQCTFAKNWVYEADYISPHCYLYLLECLMFFASACQGCGGYFFSTKSLVFEVLKTKMLKYHGCKGYLDSCLASLPDRQLRISVDKSLKFIIRMIRQLLMNKRRIRGWMKRSLMPDSDYGHLITKLVIILCIAYLNTATRTVPDHVENLLSQNSIYQYLPLNFSERLRRAMSSENGDTDHFLINFSDALSAVENPLVVICSQEHCSRFISLNAVVILSDELKCRENVAGKLFSKDLGNVRDNKSAVGPSRECPSESNPTITDSQAIGSETLPTSTAPANEKQDLGKEVRNEDEFTEEQYRHFLEKVEESQPSAKQDVEYIANFLGRSIAWLNHKGPISGCKEDLLGSAKRLNDEFKLLSAMKSEIPDGNLRAKLRQWRSSLQPIMDSVFMQSHDSMEETTQSDKGIDEAECSTEITNDEVVEAADASCRNQSRNEKAKESKRARKKGKGKGKGKRR